MNEIKIWIVIAMLILLLLLVLWPKVDARPPVPVIEFDIAGHPNCPRYPKSVDELRRWVLVNPQRFYEAGELKRGGCVELIDKLQRVRGAMCRVAIRCRGI